MRGQLEPDSNVVPEENNFALQQIQLYRPALPSFRWRPLNARAVPCSRETLNYLNVRIFRHSAEFLIVGRLDLGAEFMLAPA